jgi:subtilisin-like proprotein convertase family protein
MSHVSKKCFQYAALLTGYFLSLHAQAAGPFIVPGTGGGAIPDNSPVGVTTTFDVSGVSGQIGTVTVRLDVSHSFAGDLAATLYAPNGIAKLKLFGNVGANRGSTNGDSSDFNGVYEFRDLATQDFWVAAANADSATAIPTGSYRTTTGGTEVLGAEPRTNVGGCSSFLQLAFGGLRPSQSNGQWRLVVTDSSNSDVGTVNAATSVLQIDTVAEIPEIPLLRSGFEDNDTPSPATPIPAIVASNVVGNCTPGINSPSGSGLSDFVVTRPLSGNSAEWRIKKNDGTATGVEFAAFTWGRLSDTVLMGDFDGDGISDATVWNPLATQRFSVRRSSRPQDVPLEFAFGEPGGVADLIADFDGDRVTDFALYRNGNMTDPTAHFFVRKSTSGLVFDYAIPNSVNSVPFSIRDINADGRADFGIQYTAGGGPGGFRMFSGLDGSPLNAFIFGFSSDFVVPGQFVGDGVPDIVVSRNVNPGTGTVKYGFPRDMATGGGDAFNLATGIVFGLSGDFIAQGDYDGDGTIDFAVWRADNNGGPSKYIIRKSSAPSVPFEVFFGNITDYPVNNWDVH